MSNEGRPRQKKKFWASTCAGYRSITVDQSWSKQWTNSGRNSGPILVEITHRGAVMGHPSSAPHSHAVFDFATAAAFGGSCRRQPRQAHCTGAVPAARLWARRTITYRSIEAGCSADQQTCISVSWTGIWRHSIPLMASRLSNKPLLGIQTCRISHYLASRHVESAVPAPRVRVQTIHGKST